MCSQPARGAPMRLALARSAATTDAVLSRGDTRIALRRNAVGVALAHNHPHGLALPSREDIGLTKQIKQALQTVGVQLLEHVIVAGEEFVSMADSGMLG